MLYWLYPYFFFTALLQACRSTRMSHGGGVSGSQLSLLPDEDAVDAVANVNTRRIPVEADFLFAYSTVPGKRVVVLSVKLKL